MFGDLIHCVCCVMQQKTSNLLNIFTKIGRVQISLGVPACLWAECETNESNKRRKREARNLHVVEYMAKSTNTTTCENSFVWHLFTANERSF